MSLPKPADALTATSWGRLVAATVLNPADLRTALRQTLVRVLAIAHGQNSRPLLVLLVGPRAPSVELGRIVQRLADSLRMEPHLGVDAAPRNARLERTVTWREVHCASDLECAAVLEGVKLGTDSITSEIMCVLTRSQSPSGEISPATSLLDVLLWLWPTRGGLPSKKKSAASEDDEEGPPP